MVAAGSSLMAASSKRRCSVSFISLVSTLPATATAMSAVFSQISARAWSRAWPMSRWARCLANSASPWACLIRLVGGRLGLLPGLVENRPHLVAGPGHQLAVLGQVGLAFVAGPLRLEEHMLQVLFAAVKCRQERLPGEPSQDEQQHDEDNQGPDRQAWLGFDRVDRWFRRHTLGLGDLRLFSPMVVRRGLETRAPAAAPPAPNAGEAKSQEPQGKQTISFVVTWKNSRAGRTNHSDARPGHRGTAHTRELAPDGPADANSASSAMARRVDPASLPPPVPAINRTSLATE